jgi:hypothetical protein
LPIFIKMGPRVKVAVMEGELEDRQAVVERVEGELDWKGRELVPVHRPYRRDIGGFLRIR